ncbi:MAG: adenylate/guanylate cyclase domain-containing protein [Leptolyngbya sp. DLM2.Bin15]|nr:MAG: adenylate/guanylate cyclase domain-containing protein [Leptolyngbya sp. DLM2.Bin15]
MTGSSNGMLANLFQVDSTVDLTGQLRDLPVPQFMTLLEQITTEFEYFLQAIELINNEKLEVMLERLLDAFTHKIGQILQAEHTTIFLVDEEKQQLWCKTVSSDQPGAELRVPMNTGIIGHVASTGEPLNIHDVDTHPLFNRDTDRHTGRQTRNLLCMPVMNRKSQVVAVVQLVNKSSGKPFTEVDQALFGEFAASIGVILESCNLFYIAARNQRGAAALLEATASLGQSLNLDDTLSKVMDEARDLMQADRSTLFLIDRDRHELWSKVAVADDRNNRVEIRLPANRGIAGYVASTGETLNIPNAYEDPRFDPTVDQSTGYHTRNILCMPVFNSSGALIGVTQLINKDQGSFTGSDEDFMRAFNIQAGIALENAQLFQNILLEKQYQKDMLQSLSDAVISTDMDGRIVTINEAALELLGCLIQGGEGWQCQTLWTQNLVGRPVWSVVPVESLQMRLEDSLKTGARHYVPEQTLHVAIALEDDDPLPVLAAWDAEQEGFTAWSIGEVLDPAATVQRFERSINLTVNPLTNPTGSVRGGLVVLEDISSEKRMKTTLYRYMNPEVADQVIAIGEDALMEGERREVTILFSDIRGYTSITESMEAAEVVSLLNSYFETMVEAVFNYKGTLDKFIGDALMAVFGAPLTLETHAWKAVQSALDMRHRLELFNTERHRSGDRELHIGIGLSSGEVVCGNIGSKKRMDYTVIGDGVDISSRLEGVTKIYGNWDQSCNIIISEFTHSECHDKIWVRELDRIRVKGKERSLTIYELLGDRQMVFTPTQHQFLEHYLAGRQAYGDRQFDQALKQFEQAKIICPGDRATHLHLERSRLYLQNPPHDDWDGVHTLTSK